MVNRQKLGLTLGTFVALVHTVWSILVATNTAQPVADWLHKLHFVSMSYQVSPFDLGTAALLVVVTFLIGNVVGMVLGTLWNAFNGK